MKEITGGKLCDVVYDGVGKTTFPASLDCIRPLGMFVSYGSASGQIDAFNINMLQFKGSLFATRPTLNHYAAKREDLLAIAKDLFDVVGSGAVKIDVSQKYRAEGRPQGARGSGRPQDHRVVDPDAVVRCVAGSSAAAAMRATRLPATVSACRSRLPEFDAFCRAAFCWNMRPGRHLRRRELRFMGRITTHVLDTAAGRPAAGLKVVLTRLDRRRPRSWPRP